MTPQEFRRKKYGNNRHTSGYIDLYNSDGIIIDRQRYTSKKNRHSRMVGIIEQYQNTGAFMQIESKLNKKLVSK